MSCTYIYNGREYSRTGVLRALSQGPSAMSKSAMDFLTSKLGMSPSEIEVVTGLIDNKALGQFTEDGRILLSSMADDSVAYHEAFHRVFRMYLTPEERQAYYKEFRKKANYKQLLDKYRKDYGNNEEELIEEYLADEFADYVLNNGNVKVDSEAKSLFEKLIMFLKKLFGLNKRDVRKLYSQIERGDFSKREPDAKFGYFKSAYKVEINGNGYSYQQKNDTVDTMAKLFITELLSQDSIYAFVNNEFSTDDLNSVLTNAVIDTIDIIEKSNPTLANDLKQDYFNEDKSYIKDQLKFKIQSLIGKLSFTSEKVKLNQKSTEDIEDILDAKESEESGEVGIEDSRANDDAGSIFKQSLELDPKVSLSKAIKLLLFTLDDVKNINSFNIPSSVGWGKAFNKIAQHLSGVPTKDSIKHLSKLSSTYPWVNDLIEQLGGINPNINTITADTLRLRNEFIQTFSKTTISYLMAEITSDNVKVFNANQNTYEKKKLNEWATKMKKIYLDDSMGYEKWISKLQLLDRNSSVDDYVKLLGITVTDELKSGVLFKNGAQDRTYRSVLEIITTSILKYAKTNPKGIDITNIFSKDGFDIEGVLINLSKVQQQYEDSVDAMVHARGKNFYVIAQNTHVTNTINTLNYIANLINPKDSLENKLKIVHEYLPNILNYQTVTKLEDGSYQVTSDWLNHILNGNEIKTHVVLGVKNTKGDEDDLSELDEADLHSTTLNMSLRGVNISMKHSDRSTFYAYQLTNKDYLVDPSDYTTYNDTVNYLTTYLTNQMMIEKRRAMLENAPDIQYFNKSYKKSTIFPKFTDLTTLDLNSAEVQDYIKQQVQEAIDNYVKELKDWNIVSDNNYIGVGEEIAVQFNLKEKDLNKRNDNIKYMAAIVYANQLVSHNEEMKIFLGDFAFFKSADDFYKRMSTTSGTGNNMINEDITNQFVQKANEREFEIVNPRTGELQKMTYTRKVDGTFIALTAEEQKDYKSKVANDGSFTSPVNGKKISGIQFAYEDNFIKDLTLRGVEITDEVKSFISSLSENYLSNYKSINENDGQSWVNMFFYREYMLKNKTWSTEMDNLFKAELKILSAKSLEDIIDLTISIGGEEVSVFNWNNWQSTEDNLSLFDSVHTLKPQYAGFTQTYQDYKRNIEAQLTNLDQRVNPYTIFKTSYHVLWPSTIIGTNLSQMHHFMLTNNVDVIHMGSANKSGAIDIKSVFKKYENQLTEKQKKVISKGFELYDDDGYFNDSIFTEGIGAKLLENSVSVAFFESLKDQVKIGNYEKTTIKGSTQSLKILISNLYDNGKLRFESADRLLQNYKSIISELVFRNIEELAKELKQSNGGQIALDNLVKTIKQSAEDRSSPINIIEAIEVFADNPFIETLPNKNKIENIIYSIVTNNLINFKRPGNAYPLVAATGFEKLGSRNKEFTSEYLNFYGIETDAAGNLQSLKPAEIVIPIPKEWIKTLLEKAKTDNIVKAIIWANKQIADGKLNVTVKGLRIPNQALSSNDIFKIKEFKLPTNVSYAIVPPEIVTKVGSDFDIDKESVYWADSEDLFNNDINVKKYNSNALQSYSKTDLYKFLLQFEQSLLTHPRNAHILMMPVIDDLLKQDAYNEIVTNDAKKPTTYFNALSPQTNVEKAINYIKSKMGVGVVALDITGQSIFTTEGIKMQLQVVTPDEQVIYRNLMFEGMYYNDGLDYAYDNNNRLISEIQSQTMTSQVDAGKDPYAVLLGINSQTLGPVMYLVRRGVPITTVLKFVSQPIIKDYLKLQRVNESIINKQRGSELSKSQLIDKLFELYKVPSTIAEEPFFRDDPNNVFTEEDFNDGLKNNLSLNKQVFMFKYFLDILEETKQFNQLKNGLTVDTKGKKDKAAVTNFNILWETIKNAQLLTPESLDILQNDSVLTPFFRAQEYYTIWFDNLYVLERIPSLVTKRNSMVRYQKGDYAKERFINTWNNDFLLFVVQNFVDDFSINDFDTLLGYTNNPSVAKQLIDLKAKYPDNLALNALYNLINFAKDEFNNKSSDIVRLFEINTQPVDLNDLIDSLHDIKNEIDENIYKSIIRLSLYQAGFNNSPFSLNKIIPSLDKTIRNNKDNLISYDVDYLYDIQLKAIGYLNQLNDNTLETLVNQFETLFYLNNPSFLSKSIKSDGVGLYLKYNFTTKQFDIRDSKGVLPRIGDSYRKRYFLEQLNNLQYTQQLDDKDLYNQAFDDSLPFEDAIYEPIPSKSNKGLPVSTNTINIYAGTNENAELSNFAERPFTATLGVEPLGKFQTVEGAFQAAKLLYTDEGLSDSNKNILKELQKASGSKAKSIGRSIQNLNKEDWDENSSEIMKDLIKQSFEQNPNALSKLLATGNATLTHTQDKGKWGTEFPKLLMEVREELSASTANKLSILQSRNNPITYTNLQEKALLEIQDLINKGEQSYFLLAGYAGTGKTTIAENIVRYSQQSKKEVHVLAPTNKAVKVLKDKLNVDSNLVEPSTLHRALYGEPDPETGQWIPKSDFKNSIIIVDESSMISTNVLRDLIAQSKDKNNVIVFMLDRFQLQPVGDDPNLGGALNNPTALISEGIKKFNGTIELTEVKRQAVDSNVLKIATIIRGTKKPYRPGKSIKNFTVINNINEFQKEFETSVKNNENSVMIVATNKSRIAMNDLAKTAKYGENKRILNTNDTLIAIANSISYPNAEIFNIQDIQYLHNTPIKIKLNPNEKEYSIYVAEATDPVTNKRITIFHLPDVDKPSIYHQQIYKALQFSSPQTVEILNRFIVSKGKNGFTIDPNIVIATYGYAITAHKSQGSQWEKVFVNHDYNADSWNPARWLYTAITRSSKDVILKSSNYNMILDADKVEDTFDKVLNPTISEHDYVSNVGTTGDVDFLAPTDEFIDDVFETQMTEEEKQELLNKCKGNSNYLSDMGFTPIAKRGLNMDFTPGGSWTLEKDLKGYPTHAQGGVDLKFDDTGIQFHNGTHHVKASCGLCLPSLNKMKS